MGLRTYILRRLLLAIPVLFGAVIFLFAVIQFIPPLVRATLFITNAKQAKYITLIAKENGLYDPV